MAENNHPTVKLAGCGRCNFSGIVTLEKDKQEFSFACVCPRGSQVSSLMNLKSYEIGLSLGYRMTENTELAFQGYDDYVRGKDSKPLSYTQGKIFGAFQKED